MMKALKTWAAAATLMALTSGAQATLIDRGGGMIYDTTLNITWMADLNHSGLGSVTWAEAGVWASDLEYGGFNDWRLPSALNTDGSGPCFGFDCADSEMGHLFYVDLGGHAGESVLDQTGDTAQQIANQALFSNLVPQIYWSGTDLGGNNAAYFITLNGVQGGDSKGLPNGRATAVRDGDVAAAVPEPQTLSLLLLGLGAAAMVRSRQTRRARVVGGIARRGRR